MFSDVSKYQWKAFRVGGAITSGVLAGTILAFVYNDEFSSLLDLRFTFAFSAVCSLLFSLAAVSQTFNEDFIKDKWFVSASVLVAAVANVNPELAVRLLFGSLIACGLFIAIGKVFLSESVEGFRPMLEEDGQSETGYFPYWAAPFFAGVPMVIGLFYEIGNGVSGSGRIITYSAIWAFISSFTIIKTNASVQSHGTWFEKALDSLSGSSFQWSLTKYPTAGFYYRRMKVDNWRTVQKLRHYYEQNPPEGKEADITRLDYQRQIVVCASSASYLSEDEYECWDVSSDLSLLEKPDKFRKHYKSRCFGGQHYRIAGDGRVPFALGILVGFPAGIMMPLVVIMIVEFIRLV